MVNFVGACEIVKGDVPGSLAEFDKAIELDPRQKACTFIKILGKKRLYHFGLECSCLSVPVT